MIYKRSRLGYYFNKIKEIIAAQSTSVDAVGGVTVSSDNLIKAAEDVLAKAANN